VSQVRFTRRARQDLLDIWLYIAPRNPVAADRVFDRIEASCQLLRDHPELGPARPEIADNARALLIERWLALYRLIERGVQVVRIVDGSRDLAKLNGLQNSAQKQVSHATHVAATVEYPFRWEAAAPAAKPQPVSSTTVT
jgi:toxin ParE1/3/4